MIMGDFRVPAIDVPAIDVPVEVPPWEAPKRSFSSMKPR